MCVGRSHNIVGDNVGVSTQLGQQYGNFAGTAIWRLCFLPFAVQPTKPSRMLFFTGTYVSCLGCQITSNGKAGVATLFASYKYGSD